MNTHDVDRFGGRPIVLPRQGYAVAIGRGDRVVTHIPAERCLSIIQILADDAVAMSLGDIATRLQLPKSGTHRLLATLVAHGWVEQLESTGFYRLTMRLAVLGQQFFVATGIPHICQPQLDRLAEQSREFVRLAVVDSESLVWVADAQGARGGLMYVPSLASATVPLFATASGKAWLATLPTEVATRIALKDGAFYNADAYGPNVVRTVEGLVQELEATRQLGYGVAVSEAETGVSAVAASIRSGADGAAVGTVSVAGPSVRLTDERIRELAPLVVKAASDISQLWPPRVPESPFRNAHAPRTRHWAA